jgi:hypothetical protein
MAQGADFVKNGDDWALKYKTEVKKVFDDEHSLKFVASNKDYTAEWDFKPADLNKDGLQTQLEVEAKCVPAKSEWEGKVEFKVGGFGAGPVKGYTELQVDSNNKKDHKLTVSQNLWFDGGFNTAVNVVTDVNKKEIVDLDTILAATNQSWGDAWIRGCVTKKLWGLGYSTTHGGNNHHSFELQYNGDKDARLGLMEMPLYLRGGSCFHLENKTKLHTYLNFG